MLTARHILTATLLIAALSLVAMGLSLWQEMEPSQLGGDTYGTHAHGQRGAFELLQKLQVPAQRSLLPPSGSPDWPTTLVLWGPHQSLAQLEPVYLRRVASWVRRGGRAVIALPRPDSDAVFSLARSRESTPTVSIPEELGLKHVATELVDLDESEETADAEAKKPTPNENDEVDLFATRDPRTETAAVACGGDLGSWGGVVAKLEVPLRRLQTLDTSASPPAGWLNVATLDGNEKTLVASYRMGLGEVLLVSDPELLANRLLGQADNSLLAWRLCVAPGRAVAWDEFYHGLTIRGNPLYLLRREPFGALMAATLILIAIRVWRQAVRFGPPTIVPPIARRTLAEYIETMARLFQRGRRGQAFLLAELRVGMLWWLRSELGLHLGQEKPETIDAVLRRKHPERAARLIDALSAIDRTLAAGQELSEKETVLALQRISACL